MVILADYTLVFKEKSGVFTFGAKKNQYVRVAMAN